MSSEKPIIMSSESVRAILNGRKTQTRRVCKTPPGKSTAPYKVGSFIWVKETYTFLTHDAGFGSDVDECFYKSDAKKPLTSWNGGIIKWKNPMFMPRRFSRLTLKVTNVKLEPLHCISVNDVVAECVSLCACTCVEHIEKFKKHWNSINAKNGFPWESNPYVWVIEFKKLGNFQKNNV